MMHTTDAELLKQLAGAFWRLDRAHCIKTGDDPEQEHWLELAREAVALVRKQPARVEVVEVGT